MSSVLIIEDHKGLRDFVAEMLRLKHYEVHAAADGVEGLRLASEVQPDLIICDVMMEPINGFEVLEKIRSNPATEPIPFIIISARSDRDAVRYAMARGADDYLTKPFTRSELFDAIDARVNRRKHYHHEAERHIASTKQQLMRMLTHELRTPLISINMVVDIISRQRSYLEPDELQELLDSLISGSKRLTRMVEQIVLITQVHGGTIREDVIREKGVPMPLWETLIAAIGLARKYTYRTHTVDIDLVERDTDALVVCNMAALKHALAELITNALNFSPEGSHVTVTQWRADDRVWISITDQGSGIDPDQLEKAREFFQQLDREKQEQQGVGLGLGLSQYLIAAHGGTLELKSVKGKGTQAIISLPLYVADEDDEELDPFSQTDSLALSS
jgi:signal transduction histidine kinase